MAGTAVIEILEAIVEAIVMTTPDAASVGAAPVVPAETAEPLAIERLLGRLHPAMVHFPIALILSAGLFEIFSALRKRDKPSPTAFACLAVGTASAGLAAWFGWINADIEPQSRSAAQTLFIHRWTGVSIAGTAVLTVLFGLIARSGRGIGLYRSGLVLAMMLVSLGGYLGGELVHGKGYLIEVFRAPSAPDSASVEAGGALPVAVDPGAVAIVDATYLEIIQPIFDDRCIECHGPDKKKASLRLDDMAYVFQGAEAMWVIQPGDAEASVLYERISLPADDLDRMPAKGPPLTETQIAALRAWINAGAAWSARPAGEPTQSTAAAVDRSVGSPTATPAVARRVIDRGNQEAALARLRERGALAAPVAADTDDVEVNFSLLGDDIGDDDLALLDGLEGSLVWLNLSRTGVTDDGLGRLARFTALRRLRLDNSAVGDAGVARLASLENLESLNLYGTRVTDAALTALAGLPALRNLYLWQTQVTTDGVTRLRETRPDLTVVVETVPEKAVVAEEGTDETEPPDETTETEEVVELAALPECCAKAKAAGGECEHACCVEARAAGKICERCAGG